LDVYTALHRWRLWGGRARAAGGAGGRVLELGVGAGANLPHYRQAQRVVGLDPNPEALARARQVAGGLPFPVALVRARAEALPFAPASFDAVVGTLVFCSVNDPRAALAEARRVLAPQGTLRLVEHVLPCRGPQRLLLQLVAPLWRRCTHECRIDRETLRTVESGGWAVHELREHAGGVFIELVAGPDGEEE
jgi:ubiquinone/menaquinone biosynthesis C-methylase UbiE